MEKGRAVRLIAVHICPKCGAATERSAANPDSPITGLVRCSRCGNESGLNLEIRSIPDPDNN